MPVYVVTGMLFGDEGKGTTVEALAHATKASLIVRYSGGVQTYHTVVNQGRTHNFRQVGSAAFLGVQTHLSRFMLVEPVRLTVELDRLNVHKFSPYITIEYKAPITTTYHSWANQIKELARVTTGEIHGSCGVGIWETQRIAREHPEAAPIIDDLQDSFEFHRKLKLLQDLVLEENRHLKDVNEATKNKWKHLNTPVSEIAYFYLKAYRELKENYGVTIVSSNYLDKKLREETIIFEGSQGVLLDENYGLQPHVTGTTTLFDNVRDLLGV
jgi:adenylosuccinate synthase